MSEIIDCVADTIVLIFLQNCIEGINDLLKGRGVFISLISEVVMLSYPTLAIANWRRLQNYRQTVTSLS
jgi:hypothetical protein